MSQTRRLGAIIAADVAGYSPARAGWQVLRIRTNTRGEYREVIDSPIARPDHDAERSNV
jgi:hypothetical protein